MPTYLLHGFRWPRPLIRIHIILQNLDDCAAEWICSQKSTDSLLDNFYELFPASMPHLQRLRFIEQYDPSDTSAASLSQPYAYVADVVEEVKLGVDIDEVRGKGVSQDQWAALMEVRDRLAPDEKVGWFVVVCGDEERWAPKEELARGGLGLSPTIGHVGGQYHQSQQQYAQEQYRQQQYHQHQKQQQQQYYGEGLGIAGVERGGRQGNGGIAGRDQGRAEQERERERSTVQGRNNQNHNHNYNGRDRDNEREREGEREHEREREREREREGERQRQRERQRERERERQQERQAAEEKRRRDQGLRELRDQVGYRTESDVSDMSSTGQVTRHTTGGTTNNAQIQQRTPDTSFETPSTPPSSSAKLGGGVRRWLSKKRSQRSMKELAKAQAKESPPPLPISSPAASAGHTPASTRSRGYDQGYGHSHVQNGNLPSR